MEHDVLAGHAGRQKGPGSQAALSPVVWYSGNALFVYAALNFPVHTDGCTVILAPRQAQVFLQAILMHWAVLH